MNKHVYASALAMVCASTIAVWAQPAKENTAPTTNRFVILGCISRSPATASATPRFLLTDTRGDTPTVYQLQGDAAQFDLHVGHTVEVAGSLSAPPRGAAGSGQKQGAWTLKVASLTWISTKCSK